MFLFSCALPSCRVQHSAARDHFVPHLRLTGCWLRVMTRPIYLTFAIINGGFALLLNHHVSMLGFPDGALTAYDRATAAPMTLLTIVIGIQALYFLFRSIRPSRRALLFVIELAVAVVLIAPGLAMAMCPGFSLCRAMVQDTFGYGLDMGIGG